MSNKTIISLGVASFTVLIFFTFFFGCKRIDAGHVGIKVNMTGGDRGISKTEYVTGWVPYIKTATRVYEFPTFQQHVEYDAFTVPAKGGTIFTVHPSFNYNLNATYVDSMFATFRLPMGQLERGFLKNALLVSLREATNTFTVDSMLNSMAVYDLEVLNRLNHKLQPFFTVSTFTSGLEPTDPAIKNSINAKALAIQEAVRLQNLQLGIKVQAENEIIVAKKDSTVRVVGAQAEARSVSLMQEQLSKSPQYVELIKAQKWKGDVPTTVLGSNTPILFNLGKQ
jgi:hypothetical protein